MLSNWHVLFADNVGGPGDVIIQPSPVDTSERNRVGTILEVEEILKLIVQ